MGPLHVNRWKELLSERNTFVKVPSFHRLWFKRISDNKHFQEEEEQEEKEETSGLIVFEKLGLSTLLFSSLKHFCFDIIDEKLACMTLWKNNVKRFSNILFNWSLPSNFSFWNCPMFLPCMLKRFKCLNKIYKLSSRAITVLRRHHILSKVRSSIF